MLERLAIGVLVGICGFLTGMFAWWMLSGVPGFDLRFFFKLSLILGAVCFFLGLWRPHATIDILGAVGQKVLSLSSQVFSWFRLFR